MSVLLIRRRRPIGEPPGLASFARSNTPTPDDAGTATLDGAAGAGRIVHTLIELGYALDGVTQAVIPADIGLDVLRDLDLGRRFDTVVLGSHLVNLPEDERRAAFLALAPRHARVGGVVLVEHHPIDWAETADEVRPTHGAEVGMEEVRRDPPFVSAVSTYDIGGRYVRQRFTARVLSDVELADAIRAAGLAWRRRLSPTWIEATARQELSPPV